MFFRWIKSSYSHSTPLGLIFLEGMCFVFLRMIFNPSRGYKLDLWDNKEQSNRKGIITYSSKAYSFLMREKPLGNRPKLNP